MHWQSYHRLSEDSLLAHLAVEAVFVNVFVLVAIVLETFQMVFSCVQHKLEELVEGSFFAGASGSL